VDIPTGFSSQFKMLTFDKCRSMKKVKAQKTAFPGINVTRNPLPKGCAFLRLLACRQLLLLQNLSAPPISLTRVGEASDG
jgi:hypothetical protein